MGVLLGLREFDRWGPGCHWVFARQCLKQRATQIAASVTHVGCNLLHACCDLCHVFPSDSLSPFHHLRGAFCDGVHPGQTSTPPPSQANERADLERLSHALSEDRAAAQEAMEAAAAMRAAAEESARSVAAREVALAARQQQLADVEKALALRQAEALRKLEGLEAGMRRSLDAHRSQTEDLLTRVTAELEERAADLAAKQERFLAELAAHKNNVAHELAAER